MEAVNECLDAKSNDCSENAICEDAKEGYICSCLKGFVDASPNTTHYPGRVCNKPSKLTPGIEENKDSCDPHAPNSCRSGMVCSDKMQKGQFICECADTSHKFYEGQCRQLAACDSDADCDRNAACVNVFDSFKCQCRPGYFDVSPDPEVYPGRVCKERRLRIFM